MRCSAMRNRRHVQGGPGRTCYTRAAKPASQCRFGARGCASFEYGAVADRKGVRGMTYVISEPCIDIKDASCVEVCPVDCIHTDDAANQYFIDPDECIDCGVCAEVCPVEAIFFEDDLPEQWASFLTLNRVYFEKK